MRRGERGARTRACRVGTHADAWFSCGQAGVETSLDTARRSACATSSIEVTA